MPSTVMVTEEKRAQARKRLREFVKSSRAKKAIDEQPSGLAQIAEEEPHEVGNALGELSQLFADVAAIFSGVAGDTSNLKDNLDLNEPNRTASLHDRVAARKNYAKTLRRIANEEPEELGAAISEVYRQLDEAAEGIEAMAERFGLPLDTADPMASPEGMEAMEPEQEDQGQAEDALPEPEELPRMAASKRANLTTCKHCGAWINTAYGADSPGEHQDHSGTKSDPRAPGDFNDICDQCNYGKGLRGGPYRD